MIYKYKQKNLPEAGGWVRAVTVYCILAGRGYTDTTGTQIDKVCRTARVEWKLMDSVILMSPASLCWLAGNSSMALVK